MEAQKNHTKYTVAVRVRPSFSNSSQNVFLCHKHKYIKQYREKSILTYCFDKVYEPQHTNQDIFQDSVKQLVHHFVHNGVNTTFLAYGQTGSGKTYTLFGHHNQKNSNMGLAEYIIKEICSQVLPKKKILCSFMQIYKQKVTDLLSGKQISLRQNSNGQLILENQTICQEGSQQKILKLLKQANSNKIFGHSYVHSQSSRSHVLFNLRIEGSKSQLNIVDLCGSEVLTYQFDEKQRQETNSINLSLFTLNAVISDLCDKSPQKKKHIAFRNSVLTRLLKKSLINPHKTQVYLFCNVSPEKQHQAFSSSTLRFGQLAIQIDQNQNFKQQKVNLSQQKRDMKKVSNIIDINPKKMSKYPSMPEAWNRQIITIGQNKIVIYDITGSKENNQNNINIMFLHAYGYGCSGQDWNHVIPFLLKQYPDCNLYSVDFPGFGNSTGTKFTSRSEKFHEKGQPLQFMQQIFKVFNISQKNKVILVGYDLGGAIALSSSFYQKLSKSILATIVFHPTWTDSIQKLALISLPVLLIWVPVQTFHLITAGQKMSKVIKNSLLYKMNIGPYTGEKASGYYDSYADTQAQLMVQFINSLKPQQQDTSKKRGKIMEEKILLDVNKQQQMLIKNKEAIKFVYSMIEKKEHKQIYQSLIKGGANKPKYVRLASQIPVFNLETMNFQRLLEYGVISQLPISQFNPQNTFLLAAGRQVQVKTLINLSVLNGPESYLAYNPKGQQGITHKAYVSASQTQQQIMQSQKVKVLVLTSQQKLIQTSIDLENIIMLNSPTIFRRNVTGGLVFQDSVICKYESNFMKLKMLECFYTIKDIIPKMNFSENNLELLNLQKQCTQRIYKLFDLKHLVHEGIDNTRFTGIDVGRLAYYGQGNCHHLASVAAAFFLPFGKILGWDVIFRAGSFFKTKTQVDQNGNPLPGWDGKPNVNVQDHTWLQLVYKPSYHMTVFDPSFGLCSVSVNQIYTLKGKMHISGKLLSSSIQPQIPNKLFGGSSLKVE